MISLRDLGSLILDRGYQLNQHLRHLVSTGMIEGYADGTLDPVLLLPGVFETWQFLRPVADRLNAAGHPIHVLPGLGYNRKTIAASAELAQRYLEARDLRGVILVAHSKGGLIGKHMMVTDDRESRIAQLIAINTPFGGSKWARHHPSSTLRAFSPTDETVVRLMAALDANHRITSIYSRLDPLIPGGSRLEGATNRELDLVGHFRLLGSRQLFEAVEDSIGGVQGSEAR